MGRMGKRGEEGKRGRVGGIQKKKPPLSGGAGLADAVLFVP